MDEKILGSVPPYILVKALEILAEQFDIYSQDYIWEGREIHIPGWKEWTVLFGEYGGQLGTMFAELRRTRPDNLNKVYRLVSLERPTYPNTEQIRHVIYACDQAVSDIIGEAFPEVTHDSSFADQKLPDMLKALVLHWLEYNHPDGEIQKETREGLRKDEESASSPNVPSKPKTELDKGLSPLDEAPLWVVSRAYNDTAKAIQDLDRDGIDWPEDDWIAYNEDWDLNLWKHDDRIGATVHFGKQRGLDEFATIFSRKVQE